MFKKIMIATDGSDPGNRAAKLGIDLARVHDAEVVAVYVVNVNRLIQLPGYTGIPGLKDKLLGLMIEEGQYVTAEVEQMAQAVGVHCSKVVLRGHPSDELLSIPWNLKRICW